LKNYKLELTRQAESVLERMAIYEAETYQRVARVLDDLSRDPFQGKPLKGKLKGRYSYRIGTYRIIYAVFRDRLLVVVINIGHRRDIYR